MERITPIVKLNLKPQCKSEVYISIMMYKVDSTKDLDVVIPMYNRKEYSDNYSQTSRSLWKFYGD